MKAGKLLLPKTTEIMMITANITLKVMIRQLVFLPIPNEQHCLD